MPKVIQRTDHADSREVVFDYDDGSRVIHDTRTKSWTLFRIPTQDDLCEHAQGATNTRLADLAAYCAPIRYVPPVLADAPRHDAEVSVDD